MRMKQPFGADPSALPSTSSPSTIFVKLCAALLDLNVKCTNKPDVHLPSIMQMLRATPISTAFHALTTALHHRICHNTHVILIHPHHAAAAAATIWAPVCRAVPYHEINWITRRHQLFVLSDDANVRLVPFARTLCSPARILIDMSGVREHSARFHKSPHGD